MQTAVYVPSFDLNTVPVKDRYRVAALIPDPALADGYVHREVFGVDDFAFFAKAMQERENVILIGSYGLRPRRRSSVRSQQSIGCRSCGWNATLRWTRRWCSVAPRSRTLTAWPWTSGWMG